MAKGPLSVLLMAVWVTLASAEPAHAWGAVVAAWTAITSSTAFVAISTFFTKTFIGRLLGGVILSALQARLMRQKVATPLAGLRTTVTQTGGINACSFIVGTYATAGSKVAPEMTFAEVAGGPRNMMFQVVDTGDVPGATLSRVAIDGVWYTLGGTAHPDYGLPLQGMLDGYAWIRWHDGTQTTADATLLAKYGDPMAHIRAWSSDMIGTGVTHAILTYKGYGSLFRGIPQPLIEQTSIPLYDPRLDSTAGGSGAQRWNDTSTWAPSSNAMVLIYNAMRGIPLPYIGTWGGLIPAADLSYANWAAQMDKCDVVRSLPAGGTEPTYRAGFEVKVSDEPFAVIEELLKACNGEIAEIGGTFKARAGAPGLPVYFFTDDDCLITEAEELDPFPPFESVYNAISSTRPAPEQVYQAKASPIYTNTLWEAEDGGQRKPAELSLPAVTSGTQAQRIERAYIRDQRRMITHKVPLPPDAMILEPLDVVSWTSARNGYTAKRFEVTEVADDPMTMNQLVALREVDPSDYGASNPLDQLPESYPSTSADAVTALPSAAGTAAPTAVSVTITSATTGWATVLSTSLPGGVAAAGAMTAAAMLQVKLVGATARKPIFWRLRLTWSAGSLEVWSKSEDLHPGEVHRISNSGPAEATTNITGITVEVSGRGLAAGESIEITSCHQRAYYLRR